MMSDGGENRNAFAIN